jgi:hypothetical protein
MRSTLATHRDRSTFSERKFTANLHHAHISGMEEIVGKGDNGKGGDA